MKAWQRIVVVVALLYVTPFVLWPWIAPGHYQHFLKRSHGVALYMFLFWTGVTLAVISIIVTFVDLYRRQWKNRRVRNLWIAVLLLGGTPGWLMYLWKYGFRARPENPGLHDERIAY